MKFSKTLTGLCIALALCCSACKDKLFDFNLNNIEANGEWGIPVFNGSISVEDLFQHLDSTNIIQIGSDGSLKFIFEHDMENAVLLKDVVKFEDQHIDTSGVETVTHLPDFDFSQIIQFSLNNEDFVLKSCHVKSGLLTINFNINNGSFAYTADLTTDQILDANDNPVTLHFSSTQQQQVINLSEYSIWPTFSGDIQFHTHMVIPSVTGLEQVSYECHISLQNFDIHDVVCQFKAISNEFDAKNELSFDFDKLKFNNFQLNNAVASVYARNSICTIDGSIDQLYLFGRNGAYSPLIQSVLNFSIPISPNQYTHILDVNIPIINYTSNIDSLGIHSLLNVNPNGFSAGDISLSENSKLDLKLKTEFPVNISIDNAVYTDTVDNGLYQQFDFNTAQSIEEFTLRIAYTNAFPFDLIPSIKFLNSSTGQTFPLEMVVLHGCYNGIPYQQEPVYHVLNNSNVQEINNADKIIVNFKLNTQGNTVEIKDSQFIRLNMGAKVKYSNINL